MQLVLCLLLAALPVRTAGHCKLTFKQFTCEETNLDEFVHKFYEKSCEDGIYSPKFAINIENSNFNVVDYFPNLPTISHNFTITSLAIRNSSVEHIHQNALEELFNLQELDLSWNKLRNILFVKFLPSFLKYLYLSHNNITYLDNVFGKLTGLHYLDLSHNRINIVDFNNVHWVKRLNFSCNNIETLIPSISNSRIAAIDLSFNQLTEFNEIGLKSNFHYLNISHNKFSYVNLSSAKRKLILNLSSTDFRSALSVNNGMQAHTVDFSSSNVINWDNLTIIAIESLILKNNKIPQLNESTLELLHPYRELVSNRLKIDLSNSSIEDISEYYFGYFELLSLNLSCNNITHLRKHVFSHSVFKILDLSYSNIEDIASDAFKDLKSWFIILKGNKLKNIRQKFNKVNVKQIDLSFNYFHSVSNNSFINCYELVDLKMSHCLIEQIESQAFFGLDNLRRLDLRFNKLHILESNMFNNLRVEYLMLEGNRIDTIRTEAFNNLHDVEKLNLSRMNIRNLEAHAFNNLSKTKVVDLRHNNINTVPHYLFINMDNLTTVYLDGNNITTLDSFNRLKFHTLALSFTGIFKENKKLNLNIKYLNLKDSKIDILNNNSFAGLYNLVELRLNDSHVRLVQPGALNNLFNLKFLDSRILFKHTKVLRRDTFRDLRSLRFLDLSNLALEILETETFKGLSNLENLLLNKNNLSNLDGGTFYGLASLKILDLSENDIDTCHEKAFEGLQNLQILHLEFNNLLTIDSDVLFKDLGSLLELHLQHNNISTLDIKSFSGLKSIRKLHMQNNNISEIPIGLFQFLPTLKFLNLSNNIIQRLKTGALSNLQSLEILDMSDNELVNLEYVDIFFSLKQLQIVRFDGNHLKQFNFRRFLINLQNIKYVGISNNKWKCDTLSYIIESFNNRSINYKPEDPVYDNDNIDGVGCIDLCKFVYCSQENVEETLHYY